MSALSSPPRMVPTADAGRDAQVVTARIGPNAIIQTAAALVDHAGATVAAELLASTPWSLDHLPSSMVDEGDVTTLLQGVVTRFPGREGEAIVRASGTRTADYLLRVRIPRLAQRLLGVLPQRFALRLLLAAISRHSWTFAGSARFVTGRDAAGNVTFELRGCPVCRGRRTAIPDCHYYAAAVEHLVRRIVTPHATVREEQCEAMGAEGCRFVVNLTGASPTR